MPGSILWNTQYYHHKQFLHQKEKELKKLIVIQNQLYTNHSVRPTQESTCHHCKKNFENKSMTKNYLLRISAAEFLFFRLDSLSWTSITFPWLEIHWYYFSSTQFSSFYFYLNFHHCHRYYFHLINCWKAICINVLA